MENQNNYGMQKFDQYGGGGGGFGKGGGGKQGGFGGKQGGKQGGKSRPQQGGFGNSSLSDNFPLVFFLQTLKLNSAVPSRHGRIFVFA